MAGSMLTTFLYDGIDLIGEYNASADNTVASLCTRPRLRRSLVWFEGAGNGDARYFYTNYKGSVIAYSNAGGVSQATYKYGPYGEPTDSADNAMWSGARFRFTGQTALAEARLYYFKARIYDPAMGRFLQTDPVGAKDDLNLYAFVGNDPINAGDPTGLSCDTPTSDSNGILSVTRCQIDKDRDKLVEKYGEKAVAQLEQSYKDSVNNLLAQGENATDSIQGRSRGKQERKTNR